MSKFDPQTPEEVAARLDDLKKKLAARDGRPNYGENVEAIRKEIARLESL